MTQDVEALRVLVRVRDIGVLDGFQWDGEEAHRRPNLLSEALGVQLGAEEGGDHVRLGEGLDLAHGGTVAWGWDCGL